MRQLGKILFVNPDGKILLLKRSYFVKYARGRWDLPGGSAEKNEDPVNAATRESLEETGHSLQQKKLKLIDSVVCQRDSQTVQRFCYSYELTQNINPSLSFEHSKFKWMSASEITDTDLPDFYKNCVTKHLQES